MKDYKILDTWLIHKFQSEKIGNLWYYGAEMLICNRPIRFTIHFDGDDLWEICSDGNEDYEPTETDIEDFAQDLIWCTAEMIASCKTTKEVTDYANETIEHYNNGAFIPMALNEYDLVD